MFAIFFALTRSVDFRLCPLVQSIYLSNNYNIVCLQLQANITTVQAANRPGGQVRADFSTFPTPQFAKVTIIYDFFTILSENRKCQY